MFSSDERGGAREAVYGQPEPALQYVDFSPQSGRVTGIDVRSLAPGSELVVATRNSRYRFVMLDGCGRNTLVQGGRYFPQETTAQVEGSTLGGSLLKIGWIGLGLFLEMSVRGKRVVTSRVRSITIGVSSAPV